MLTPKQQRFVEEYLRDLNATQAALRAGYSKRTANEQAAQLMKHTEIMAAIDAAKSERSERVGVDADWVLRRLVDEAEADIADLYDEKGALLPVERWPLTWRRGLVQGVEIEALFEGSGEDRVQIGHVKRIRLDNRVRRIELIGKHVRVNAFQEQVKVTGLDTLADRLMRASKREAASVIDVQSHSVLPEQPSSPALPAAPKPLAAPVEAKPVAALAAPAASADWERPSAPPKAPAYVSPIQWPEGQAFVDHNYDSDI